MARLAAKERVLFYPTPLEIVETIATNIVSDVGGPDEKGGCILDPCAGTGEPVALLGDHLGLVSYGCELHPDRFNQAKTRLHYCLNGAREFLQVEGQFNVLFSNPPYDQALGDQRMEVEHIKRDLALLMPGGLGIWVIPEPILNYELCYLLTTALRQVMIRRFPMPEYDRFKQVVVFGLKRSDPGRNSYSQSTQLEEVIKVGLPVLSVGEFSYIYPVPNEQSVSRFELAFPEAVTILSELETQGIQTGDAWQTLMGKHGAGLDQFQPVLRLTSGHTAMAIAAGIVNGTEVVIEGQTHLIKGHTQKEIKVSRESEMDGEKAKETVREREILVQTITALNLENGVLSEYNSLADKDGFADFLLTHQDALVETIEQRFPPLFEPERDMAPWLPTLQQVQAPGKLPGQKTLGGLLPAQQVRAAALAAKLQTTNSGVLVGEMGCGKSATSAAIAALIGQGNWKLVIVSPAQVSQKWAREAGTVLARFGVSVHLIGQRRKQADGQGKWRKVAKPVLDVIRAMEEPNPSVLVMSYETAKNGPRWEHAPAVQRKVLKYSVEVEEPLPTYPYKRVVEKIVTRVEKVLCCPDCGEVLRNERDGPWLTLQELGKRKRWCADCGAALWQQVPFAYGGRVALADFLNRKYSNRYHLILDEVHHAKGSDTDVGYASADLVTGAKKVVAMTGTIYAGKASSIFFLMYRLFRWFRQLYEYNQVQRFIEHHGLQETITTTKESDRYHSSYGYARQNVRVREIPGVSPGMVTMLLGSTAFLKLADVGFVLPSYTEERLPIPLDERLEEGLQQVADVYSDAATLAREGKPGLLSAWLYASLAWMDCPVTETLTATGPEGESLGSYIIDGLLESRDDLPEEPLAKDAALLEVIESELAQERGIGVFFAQVNRRDWMGRIQKLLKRKGIYSEILRQSTCKPQDREQWYRAFVRRCRAKGQEPILLANGNLLKEGLDLIELPTLIETGIEYKINDLRQRDRRSWRLTQERPVKVIFMYYEDTWQETALQLVAAKLKAALMVDGDLAEGLAAMDMDDGNLMDALMKAVAKGRSAKVEWSGMEIAAIEKLAPQQQPVLLPDYPQPSEFDLDIVQVDLGAGARQLSWGDLEVATVTPARKLRPKRDTDRTPVRIKKVRVTDGVEQFSFL